MHTQLLNDSSEKKMKSQRYSVHQIQINIFHFQFYRKILHFIKLIDVNYRTAVIMHLWSFLIALWAAVVERVGLIHGLEAFHWALAGASWRASRARMSWYTCETRGNY